MEEILVVGSTDVDFVIGVQQVPELGETILCRSFRKICGGEGINQAYTCGRPGRDTTLLNVAGDDPLGGELIRNLQQANIDTRVIRTMNVVSISMAVVCADEKGNNFIVIIPGANNLYDVDYLRRNRVRSEESDIAPLQIEIPFESVYYAVGLVSGLHKTVILNPAPVPNGLPDEVYAELDYLTPNESEFKRPTGYPTDKVEELMVHCKSLPEKGTRNIIITLGSRGALHVNREGHTLYHPPKIQVVDTIMAGDTSNVALARELANGRFTEEVTVFANMASALAVSRVGA